MNSMNYFELQNTAERYAKGRPFFHANTIEKIKLFLNIHTKLEKVLDVACGTGLSTKALLAISDNIYGTDLAVEMLKQTEQHEQITYTVSAAESLPFEDCTFDLTTVSSGVHWFDIDQFLMESNRVLKNNAWLVIYENYFISEMENIPAFNTWWTEKYLQKFPSPSRKDNYNWSEENLKTKNYSLVKEDHFKNTIAFTKSELILYFTTQSNITAAIENEKLTYTEVEHWLDQELTPYFVNDTCEIRYGNWIKYLQKIN
jgi:ubiquinone/menaquinone biosynthesis C-methylase UbiE